MRRFVASVKQAKGADYVVRLRWRSFRLREPCGAKFDLIAHLQNMPKEQNIDDLRVLIDARATPIRILYPRASLSRASQRKRRAPNVNGKCAKRARRASSSIRAV